jgi:hypothetical protein
MTDDTYNLMYNCVRQVELSDVKLIGRLAKKARQMSTDLRSGSSHCLVTEIEMNENPKHGKLRKY